jgi:hypothetical protein
VRLRIVFLRYRDAAGLVDEAREVRILAHRRIAGRLRRQIRAVRPDLCASGAGERRCDHRKRAGKTLDDFQIDRVRGDDNRE